MRTKRSIKFWTVALFLKSEVLVAALSVSVARAFLNDKTTERENKFYGSADLLGEIIEENYSVTKAENSFPDVPVIKDPRIYNKSEDGMEMYTGVRLDFYVYCYESKTPGADGSYIKVPYNVFERFVDIRRSVCDTSGDETGTVSFPKSEEDVKSSMNGISELMPDTAQLTAQQYNDSTGWYEYDLSGLSGFDSSARYFFYNKKLWAYKGADWTGSIYQKKTSVLFSKVMMRKGIMINATPAATTTTSRIDDHGVEYYTVGSENFTQTDLNAAIYAYDEQNSRFPLDIYTSVESDNSARKIFNGFMYKILISGYGVNAEYTKQAAESAGKATNQEAFERVRDGLKEIPAAAAAIDS